MTRPIYIYSPDEELKLVLENLPGNFNTLSTSHRQHLLTQMAGMYLGIVGSREENELIDFERGQLPYKEGWMKEVLNGEVSLEFEVFTNHHSIAHIENKGRAVIQDKEGDYREFIIQEVEDDYSSDGAFKSVYAEGSEYELIGRWLPSYVEDSVNLRTALEAILQGTRFEVGIVEDQTTHKSVELKHMSKRKAVNELLNLFNCEVKYRVEVDGNRVTRRIIDVYKKRGKDNGKMFEQGKDIIKATRLIDSKGIVTALYAVGAADENGKRLTFANVEWKVENGDPVDKPLGQTWVGDPEALQVWGDQNGTVHIQGGYDGQEEDPAELLLNAWNDLQKQINIRSTYDIDVIDLAQYMDVGIESVTVGDRTRAQVTDLQPPIEVEQSVIEYNLNLNDDKLSTCKLGHFRDRLNTEERIERVEKDWNDKRGELEKKPDKVKSDLSQRIDEEMAEAERRIEEAKAELKEAMENIEIGKENIEGLEDDLSNLGYAISNRIPVGMAAEDINSSNTKILGKNLVIDGNATVTGNIGANGATFFDLGTERMVAKNATIEHAVITGVIDAPNARIQKASLEDVTITGILDAVKGRFVGTVLASKIEGSQIYGLTFDTGFSGGYRINMERQVLRFYEGGNVKMTIGFRDGDDNPLYEPFIRMGKGKSDGTSVFYVEKNEDDITLSYRARTGYSHLKMSHGGSVVLGASGNYLYLNADYKVVANTTFEAPEINQTSTVKAKDNIRKYEGDALGIVMDTDVFTYYFKKDLEKGIYDNEQVGFLAESSPMLKTDDSVSINKAVAYNWKATQQQQKNIKKLTKRIEEIELILEAI